MHEGTHVLIIHDKTGESLGTLDRSMEPCNFEWRKATNSPFMAIQMSPCIPVGHIRHVHANRVGFVLPVSFLATQITPTTACPIGRPQCNRLGTKHVCKPREHQLETFLRFEICLAL